jgi:hypothetical protein
VIEACKIYDVDFAKIKATAKVKPEKPGDLPLRRISLSAPIFPEGSRNRSWNRRCGLPTELYAKTDR